MGRRALSALFDDLYAEHARAVHAYFVGRTGDDARADDLLQETFLRVWRHLSDVLGVPPERRRYWLFGVARNVLYDAYRRQGVRGREVAETDERPAEDRAMTEAQDRREQALDLEAAIARLPIDLRTVLALSIVGGLTSGEIGEALGRPAGTVRYQLARARKQLAVEMGLTIDEPAAAEVERDAR